MSARAASPAVVAARTAVERSLADVVAGQGVVVACSGGPDSLALVGATVWACARRNVRVHAVVVDHGLQDGSDLIAAWAAGVCRRLGADSADVMVVRVGGEGGPEAAARDARFAALEVAAGQFGAQAVLLGHTLEDQAETVLLRLARGSGARSLSAMRPQSGLWRRPLLAMPRAVVHAAAHELLGPLGEEPWTDPHNGDRGFARVRVRETLDRLVGDLGPGVVMGLVRSAGMLADDADLLDGLADEAFAHLVTAAGPGLSADCADLVLLPPAVRTRVIRLMSLGVGCPPDALGYEHVARLDQFVVEWHGQGEARLPGGVVGERLCGRLCLRAR